MGKPSAQKHDDNSSASHNQFTLLARRNFLPFFLTQFLGAFNDNLFKNALIILIAFKSAGYSDASTDVLTNLSAGLFILPFFLFSATAGQLIEKYEKSRAMQYIKLLEIGIMALAALAFYLGEIYMLIALLFMMGVQSTLFGPAKYSYIPQHVGEHELLGANGLVQTGTFIAILVGTMCGGILISLEGGEMYVATAVVLLALAGYLSSRAIPLTPSANAALVVRYNLLRETMHNIHIVREQRKVFIAVLGISWFWFLGASYLVQLPNFSRTVLIANEQVVTLLLTLFTVGVGAGSLLVNRLLKGEISLRLLPVGMIGLCVFGIDLALSASPAGSGNELAGLDVFLANGHYRSMLDVLLIGVSGGLYIVPLFSYIQHHVDAGLLSRVIAGNNIFNALYMVLSAVLAMLLLGNGVSIPGFFVLVSVLNLVHGLLVIRALRD